MCLSLNWTSASASASVTAVSKLTVWELLFVSTGHWWHHANPSLAPSHEQMQSAFTLPLNTTALHRCQNKTLLTGTKTEGKSTEQDNTCRLMAYCRHWGWACGGGGRTHRRSAQLLHSKSLSHFLSNFSLGCTVARWRARGTSEQVSLCTAPSPSPLLLLALQSCWRSGRSWRREGERDNARCSTAWQHRRRNNNSQLRIDAASDRTQCHLS